MRSQEDMLRAQQERDQDALVDLLRRQGKTELAKDALNKCSGGAGRWPAT